ncbi:unnamed protein product [Choristocarpus tenellus]
MQEANESCYSVVKREFRILFGAMCRNKSADLLLAGDKLEDGLIMAVGNGSDCKEVNKSPQELSGGQQALLGLALVLALSTYHPPPLCLLDEVDAALDKTNQATAARLVAMVFQHSQALCVSHHVDFHRQSSHIVGVAMQNGVSHVRKI